MMWRMLKATGTPLVMYDSATRRLAPIDELMSAVRYRDLIGQLIARDIRTRYKRSILGVAWTMVNPLVTMVVLTIVFGQIFRIEVGNYPAYLLSGVLVWNFFSQSTTAALHQLMWGGALFHRVYVPRTIFTVAAIGTGVVNLLLALVPLAVIVALTGGLFTPALLWLVVVVPLLAMFALGIALLVSTLSISFPDVIEMYAVVLNAWFFLTPVMYPVTIVPDQYLPLVMANPMFYLVSSFRIPIHDGLTPDPAVMGAAVLAATVSLLIGWIAFTSRADRIAYRI